MDKHSSLLVQNCSDKEISFLTLKPNLFLLMLLVIYKMTASSFQIICLVGITIRDGQKKQGGHSGTL
jgi:hypothetical protein